MPAPQFHLTFSEILGQDAGMPAKLRDAMITDPVYTRLGSIFHDLPYYGNMALMAIRYGLKRPAEESFWGARLHATSPADFVAHYIAQARTSEAPLTEVERLALVGGLLSHVALDCTLHPLVNFIARKDAAADGVSESHHHRLTEKYHSLFFHVDRFGEDVIGSLEMRRRTVITKRSSYVLRNMEVPVVAFATGAIGTFYGPLLGKQPSAGEWTSWVRSFRQFGRMVSGPMARNNSHRLRTAEHREHYFQNADFDFYAFWEHSLRMGREICALALDYFEAGEFDPASREAFIAASGIDRNNLGDPSGDGLPRLPRAAAAPSPLAYSPGAFAPGGRSRSSAEASRRVA
jgi:hypothetical protein